MLSPKLSSQDFLSLRRKLNSENKLFTDPDFPPEAQSVFYTQKSPVKFVWRRPPDFAPDPKLMVDGASRFDVTQGMLGDCWLLSAMASLAQNQSLLRVVVPSDQSFEKLYAGIFHFRLWHFGEWVDVVIDDYLPTYNGKLVFAHSPEQNELWPALLEKAYAKLHSSYEALKGGRTSEAMEDFTGGVKEIVDFNQDSKDIFSLIHKSVLRSSLISCSISTGDESGETKLDNGLIAGHAYTVTDAKKVEIPNHGMLEMVRVRNPWGNEREWKGAWSDNSPEWRSIPEEQRSELELIFEDDGEFWMSFGDFQQQFTEMEICHSSIDHLDVNESIESWNLASFSGSWSKQSGTAGGCKNYPTFCNNPQISIELIEDANGDGKCSVIIALMQKDCRAQKCLGFQSNSIGFSIYKQEACELPLTKRLIDYTHSVGSSGSFTNLREVSGRFDLPSGRYVVIPCIFEPGSEGSFLLRVFTENSILHPNRDVMSEVSADLNSVEDINHTSSGESESTVKLNQGEKMFMSIAGSDGRVDADELMDVLTAALSRDLRNNVLEKDTCRALIQLVDKDRVGSLNCEQCTLLIENICRWKRVFISVVENRSETISRHQLSLALQELGYDLSTECLEVILNRFSTQEKITLQDYIAIVCRVKMLSDIFKVKHDPKKKTLTLSLETLLLNALKL